MCINSSILIMLRALINDLDEATYDDDRLSQLVVVAAQYVNKDIEGTYTISITSPDITPDPIDLEDNAFINLTVMKAACLVDRNMYRVKAALAGLDAKLGPVSLKTQQHLEGFKTLLENGPCSSYEKLLVDYKLGGAIVGHAILSPFISNSYDPYELSYPSHYRS